MGAYCPAPYRQVCGGPTEMAYIGHAQGAGGSVRLWFRSTGAIAAHLQQVARRCRLLAEPRLAASSPHEVLERRATCGLTLRVLRRSTRELLLAVGRHRRGRRATGDPRHDRIGPPLLVPIVESIAFLVMLVIAATAGCVPSRARPIVVVLFGALVVANAAAAAARLVVLVLQRGTVEGASPSAGRLLISGLLTLAITVITFGLL